MLREISGFDSDGRMLSAATPELRADGSTACGCWIYSGCYAGGHRTRRRAAGPGREQSWVAPEWGWAWPMNRRMLYNRASADPQGRPWSERKRYVWWDAEQGRWTGEDVPDFTADMPPDYEPPEGATGPEALRGDEPFIMQADGRGWLFVPSGLVDGPLPDALRAARVAVRQPALRAAREPRATSCTSAPRTASNPPRPSPAVEVFPYVMTTYRLTEHHTAGGHVAHACPTSSELQPEMFCEVSPELARERGLEHGGWATIVSARTAIEARVMVTERMPPLRAAAASCTRSACPTTGAPAASARATAPTTCSCWPSTRTCTSRR